MCTNYYHAMLCVSVVFAVAGLSGCLSVTFFANFPITYFFGPVASSLGCRSTRTLTKSYHANSYPSQLVPNTNSYLLPTRTQTISYPIPTRTQANYIELLLLCNVSYEQEHNTLFPLPCLPVPLLSPSLPISLSLTSRAP